jgi:nucleotide-binding universal stress UspA family protein
VVCAEPMQLYIEPYTNAAGIPEEVEESARGRAQQFLDDQVEQIETAGGTVAQACAQLGRPDEEIIALGEEIDASLIVVGSRGLGGIKRVLMGSVADSVVRLAHCPVL